MDAVWESHLLAEFRLPLDSVSICDYEIFMLVYSGLINCFNKNIFHYILLGVIIRSTNFTFYTFIQIFQENPHKTSLPTRKTSLLQKPKRNKKSLTKNKNQVQKDSEKLGIPRWNSYIQYIEWNSHSFDVLTPTSVHRGNHLVHCRKEDVWATEDIGGFYRDGNWSLCDIEPKWQLLTFNADY